MHRSLTCKVKAVEFQAPIEPIPQRQVGSSMRRVSMARAVGVVALLAAAVALAFVSSGGGGTKMMGAGGEARGAAVRHVVAKVSYVRTSRQLRARGMFRC